MNEQQIAYRIKQLLNRGLDLDAGKLARLKDSRERALACQHVESRVSVLAWAGNAIGRSGGPSALIRRLLLPMAGFLGNVFDIWLKPCLKKPLGFPPPPPPAPPHHRKSPRHGAS